MRAPPISVQALIAVVVIVVIVLVGISEAFNVSLKTLMQAVWVVAAVVVGAAIVISNHKGGPR